MILTHSDADHVNGLLGFPKRLTIIAHENCKTRNGGCAGRRPSRHGAASRLSFDPNCLNVKSGEERVVYKRLNSTNR